MTGTASPTPTNTSSAPICGRLVYRCSRRCRWSESSPQPLTVTLTLSEFARRAPILIAQRQRTTRTERTIPPVHQRCASLQGDIGNIYQFASIGDFKQNQLIVNGNWRRGARLTLFGYYVLNYVDANTNGASSFLFDQYNPQLSYGPWLMTCTTASSSAAP